MSFTLYSGFCEPMDSSQYRELEMFPKKMERKSSDIRHRKNTGDWKTSRLLGLRRH